MSLTAPTLSPNVMRPAGRTASEGAAALPLLTARNAWRVLCLRTGIPVSRATFYRWLASGKVYSVRLGHKMYVPLTVLTELVKHCRAGGDE